MNLSKEQLKIISEAIDLNEVKKVILENINEYNLFIIEEVNIDDNKKDIPRKDDINGCGSLCTI